MAMTKAEQAAFAALQEENAQLRAFAAKGFAQPVARDLKAPTDYDLMTSGFDYTFGLALGYGSIDGCVYAAWSESNAHGRGTKRTGSASRDPVDLYSTKALALQALRYDLDVFYAKKAAAIDAALQAEALVGRSDARGPGSSHTPAAPATSQLTHRHVTFALSVTRFDTPVSSSSPKTADALVAAGYLRVTKGLYKLTASGKQWLASRQAEDIPSKPKHGRSPPR